MRGVAGWLAVVLGVGSLLFQVWIVAGRAGVREQAMALDFPLTSLGEGLMAMVLPMAASTLSALLSLVSLRLRSGRIGLATAVVGWLAIWLIMGREGFEYLF